MELSEEDKYKDLYKKRSLNLPSLEGPDFKNVGWSPVKPGGSNFKTHKLVVIDDEQMEFVGTFGFSLFGFMFLAIGLVPLIFLILGKVTAPSIFLFLFCSIFGLVGANLLYSINRPTIFSKKDRIYWKGRDKPIPLFSLFTSKGDHVIVDLENIKAIQFLPERIVDSDSNYTSYEINIVLNNDERINVVDHGSKTAARKDAYILADFLDVPILDLLNKL